MANANNYHVQLLDFYNCCGVKIIHHLFTVPPKTLSEYQRNVLGSYSGTQKQCDEYNKNNTESISEYTRRLTEEVEKFQKDYKNKKSYFICVTNTHEKEAGANEILLDLGWEVLVPETKNPTGTSITMFIYHLLPREKKEVKSVIKKAV